jgi:NAD+-dependent farnesol dehydrogenase
MRVLVTGGTGYLGEAIVRALAARGHETIVFARHASRADLPGRAVDGDVRDRAALVTAARGCEAMFHTAALVSLWRRDASEFDAINVGGLGHAIAAARENGLARLVYTSSFLARPPLGRTAPLRANDYQRTKVIADELAQRARDDGAPIVRIYPGVIYGPGTMTEGNLLGRMLQDHRAGRLPGLIGPERVWSYAWIDDVAQAHVAAVERAQPGTDYELGGANVAQIRPFEIARELGGGAMPRRIPFAVAAAVGTVEEWRARLTGHAPRLTRGTVEIFRHDWPVEAAAAVRDLNYRVTPLRQGIEMLLSGQRPTAHGPGGS